MLFLRVIAWYGAEKFSLKKVVSIFTSGGDMSLIGPRPDPLDDMDIYTEHQKKKLPMYLLAFKRCQ